MEPAGGGAAFLPLQGLCSTPTSGAPPEPPTLTETKGSFVAGLDAESVAEVAVDITLGSDCGYHLGE